jgi:hypothetical protein
MCHSRAWFLCARVWVTGAEASPACPLEICRWRPRPGRPRSRRLRNATTIFVDLGAPKLRKQARAHWIRACLPLMLPCTSKLDALIRLKTRSKESRGTRRPRLFRFTDQFHGHSRYRQVKDTCARSRSCVRVPRPRAHDAIKQSRARHAYRLPLRRTVAAGYMKRVRDRSPKGHLGA